MLQGDGTKTGMADGRFSSVTCFHVLHHVPTPDALDLEPVRLRHVEEGETFVPLEPETIAARLAEAGFEDTTVDAGSYQVLCRSRKPTEMGSS